MNFADGVVKQMVFVKKLMGQKGWSWPWRPGLIGWLLMSIPLRSRSREWEPGSEGNCYNEKTPVNYEAYWGSGSDLPTMHMVEKVLQSLSSKVSVINITQLSEYRKDGHPSIYRKFWETLSPEQLSNPSSYSDCIHWCLPGVPDVWNELLVQFL
ncbi:Protein trichome birefringence-like 35 [Sarracenia purpurea var. burkii]